MPRIGNLVVVMAVLVPSIVRADPTGRDAGGHAARGQLAAPKLGATHEIVMPGLERGSKSEAPAADLRAPARSRAPRARTRHSHVTQLASFEHRDRRAVKELDDIARAWKRNETWGAILVDSYGAPQRSSQEVRAYLLYRGVPAEVVTVVAHDDESTADAGARFVISAVTCDDVTIACRPHATGP